MLAWLRRKWAVCWLCFAGLTTCLDAWSNKESVPDMNVTLSAYAIWLFPHILLGLGVFLGGIGATIVGVEGGKWYLDRRREGPQVRKFHSLTERIEKLKADLIEYYERPAPLGWRLGRFNVLNAESSMVRTELQSLGIQIPIFEHADNQAHVEHQISYLGAVEQLARRSNLRDARKMHEEPEWLYTGPKEDGETVHDS